MAGLFGATYGDSQRVFKRAGAPLPDPRAARYARGPDGGRVVEQLAGDPRTGALATRATARFQTDVTQATDWAYHQGRAQVDEGTNPHVIPFGRRLLTPSEFGSTMAPPGVTHLALSRRTRPTTENVYIDDNDEGDFGSLGSRIPGDTLFATTIAQWNYIMAQEQVKLARSNPEAYKLLTARDLWWGIDRQTRDSALRFGAFDYAGFFIDGVVDEEVGMDGASTSQTEGYRMTRDGLISGPPTNPRGKVVTIISRGTVHLADTWDGKGVREGAKLFLVLRKYEPPPEGKMKFSLAQKPIDSLMDNHGFVVHHTLNATVPGVGVGAPDLVLRPWMLSCVAEPNGDPLDMDYAECVDEWGRTRYDGLILPVARVLHADRYGIRKNGAVPLPQELRAYTDSSKTLHAYPINVIMNPEDGLLSTL